MFPRPTNIFCSPMRAWVLGALLCLLGAAAQVGAQGDALPVCNCSSSSVGAPDGRDYYYDAEPSAAAEPARPACRPCFEGSGCALGPDGEPVCQCAPYRFGESTT